MNSIQITSSVNAKTMETSVPNHLVRMAPHVIVDGVDSCATAPLHLLQETHVKKVRFKYSVVFAVNQSGFDQLPKIFSTGSC